jgi:hypothetical protein
MAKNNVKNNQDKMPTKYQRADRSKLLNCKFNSVLSGNTISVQRGTYTIANALRSQFGIIVLILILGVSCNRQSSTRSQTNNVELQNNETQESIVIKEVRKTPSFPLDTLNFLDLDALLSYQNEDFYGNLYERILSYSLSSEIRIIRNELFARKGYIFKDTFLNEFFTYTKWYQPRYSSMDSIVFSSQEQALLDTLIRYEKKNINYTNDTFKDILLNQYLKPADGRKISYALWMKGTEKKPRIVYGSPWEFYGAYSIVQFDEINNFYHCIFNLWGGGDSDGTYTIYIMTKNLEIVDEKHLDYTYGIPKTVGSNKYQCIRYKQIGEHDDGEPEYAEVGLFTYRITDSGKIEIIKEENAK